MRFWPFGRETVHAPSPEIIEMEQRTSELEGRADKVEISLRERLARNHFAEGIAMSWGQMQDQRRKV